MARFLVASLALISITFGVFGLPSDKNPDARRFFHHGNRMEACAKNVTADEIKNFVSDIMRNGRPSEDPPQEIKCAVRCLLENKGIMNEFNDEVTLPPRVTGEVRDSLNNCFSKIESNGCDKAVEVKICMHDEQKKRQKQVAE